jgi:hypothetical protein
MKEIQAAHDFKPTNPKDRTAISKIDLSLFPDTAIAYGALAMAEGDLKYGGYNYRPSGVLASVYTSAARRHLSKWWNGDDADSLTKVHHLASALGCIAILIDSLECGVLKDDRPPKVGLEPLYERLQAVVKHLQKTFPEAAPRYTELTHGEKK